MDVDDECLYESFQAMMTGDTQFKDFTDKWLLQSWFKKKNSENINFQIFNLGSFLYTLTQEWLKKIIRKFLTSC